MNKYFLEYQLNWINDKSNIKIWEKSRRIGASYIQAYEDVCDCIDRVVPDVWFSSADMTAAREYILYCEKYAKIFDAGAKSLGEIVIDKEKDVKAFCIEFANGTRINALSSNPTQFRSKGGKVILDEFAHHDNPEELWTAALPCITWGFPLRILSTHKGLDSLFNRFIQDIKSGKKQWSLHKTTIYDAVEQGLADKILKKKLTNKEREAWIESIKENAFDENTWNQEYCCNPENNGSGNVVQKFVNDCIFQNGEWVYTKESNVRPVNYINTATVHITCDFNKNPNSWALAHKTSTKAFIFDEIILEDSETENNIKIFNERYPEHKGKIIINGDCSGRQHRSNSKHCDYDQMVNYLTNECGYSDDDVSLEVPGFNPDRYQRVATFNSKVRNKDGEPEIFIDPKCEWIIYNCENLKKIPGSNKFKEYTPLQILKNPKWKFLAHPFDAISYMIFQYWHIGRVYKDEPQKPKTIKEQWKERT